MLQDIRQALRSLAKHSFSAALIVLCIATSSAALYAQEPSASDTASFLSRVADQGLTDAQRQKLAAAFELLAPLHRGVVHEHLRAIYVGDDTAGLRNANAVTMYDPLAEEPTFRLVIHARVFEETLSELATRKEEQLFDAAGSSLSVTVIAGSMDALAFVLLHEATHMADIALGFSQEVVPDRRSEASFLREAWESALVPSAAYSGETLEASFWRTGQRLAIEKALALYEELGRTPFVSVYGSRSIAEDFAELVAWWQMTEIHGQPYRIEVREGSRVIQSYEPMKSALVRSRLSGLARFDSPYLAPSSGRSAR